MRTSRLRVFALLASATLLAFGFTPAASGSATNGFISLAGEDAATFRVPSDMTLVRNLEFAAYGLRYERYQQYFGNPAAEVVGGQITLLRDRADTVVTALGKHYSGIAPKNSVRAAGSATVQQIIGGLGITARPSVRLRIDPSDGRFYHQLTDTQFDSRWVWWIDAEIGSVLRHFNDIAFNHGTGVKGDTKSMLGETKFHAFSGHGASGSHWDLISSDDRRITFDTLNNTDFLKHDVTDSDNHWTFVTSDRKSPGQPAMVDAQVHSGYYDDYLLDRHDFNFLDCGHQAMESVVHFSVEADTAFWSGNQVFYGDGETGESREFSGGLDVTAHEFTHGVTDCTSDLQVFTGEAGALNESFSDILGNSTEFFAAEPTSTNCVRATGQTVCADWWIGEDVVLVSDTVPGYRNMADPAEDGHPDHYSEYFAGLGTHANGGISNHAYYLLVNGGSNAGEARGHSHTGPVVTGIGIQDAERIFFLGFTALTENASFCDARISTVSQAQTLFGSASQQKASTKDAWQAVGVTAALCGS